MRRPISVLYVESDGGDAESAAPHLEGAPDDISVVHADDEAAALDRLAAESIDCVVSDGDGPAALESVRAEYPDVPIVLYGNGRGGAQPGAAATHSVPAGDGDRLARRIEDAVRDGSGDPTGLAAAIPDGAIAIDEDETVCEANAAAREGLGVDALVGRSLESLVEAGHVGADALAEYRAAVESLRAGESETVRIEFDLTGDGDRRTFEANLAPRPGEGFTGTVGTIRDVTERSAREDELERYETLLRTIPDTVVMTDIEGNQLEVHGFEGWSGYTREELLGMNIAETMPEEHLETAEEVAVELFEDDDREKATYEMEIETKDGERIPIENHLRLLPPDENGEIPGTMSVLRNIADRKERERQLNALNETMRELVTADSPAEVAELVVDTARDILGFEINTVAYYDDEAGNLEPVASSAAADGLLGDIRPFEPGESLAWEAFETGEIRAYEDVGSEDGIHNPETDIRREIICPLGEYGVLLLGSTTPGEFEDREISLAEILAGNVEAALDRAFYVSELEEREAELELYETTVESTHDGIGVIDEHGEYLLVNEVLADVVGYEPEELRGSAAVETTNERMWEAPEDFEQRWLDAWTQAHEEGRAEFSFEATYLADGNRSIVDNRVTAMQRSDGSVVYVVVGRDITEERDRQRQIEHLHESTRELMAAESRTAVASEVVEAVETTLGFPASVVRLVDDAGDRLEPVTVTDGARELLGDRSSMSVADSSIGQAFERGEPLLVDDLHEHVDDPIETDVRSVLSVPIGEFGMLSIVDDAVGAYDESDVHIAEILTSNAEAAFERVDREEALRERERALSRQIDRLDQFANILSHDLRNPLNVAKGHLAFVEEQVDDPDHVETVGEALDRMAAIIEDVLTLAREGDEATELAPVALHETVESCWVTVETADATLLADTDRTILADEGRLQQLLENLIRNAVDHVGESVTIRVGDLEGGFYVEDDGPGIPEADRGSVFEAGYSTGEEGTGFGLNIVRTIAEAHEWDVGLTEGSDGGARFEFTGVDGVEP